MNNRFCFLLSLLILISIKGVTQVPDGYYSNAGGLYGVELKTALNDIIKDHKEFPYTSTSTDVWDILKETDKDPLNQDNVILLYTGWSVNAAQEYNSGSGWSREHVWAKSRGDFGTSLGPGTDVHHLRPCDISVNSARNSRWFDNCDEPYYDGGILTNSYTSSTDWVWKPRDAVKGDVARMIFYMATRYEGKNGDPDLYLIDSLPQDKYTNDPVHARLSTLLEWHHEDPVDDFERNRNEVIYSYQNNRNPFIDHPEWATDIWVNQAPSFEDVSLTPENPTDIDIVRVSANIQDADGSIFEALLYWGFTEDSLTNWENFATTNGTLWISSVPRQPGDSSIYFQAMAIDDDNDTTLSALMTYTIVESPNSVDAKKNSGVYFYPNPTTDMVYVKNPSNYKLSLYSLQGKKLSDLLNDEFSTASYPAGTYILRVYNKGKSIDERSIIIKK